jgi:hypothetical protein
MLLGFLAAFFTLYEFYLFLKLHFVAEVTTTATAAL